MSAGQGRSPFHESVPGKMSALGHERTLANRSGTSALPPNQTLFSVQADIRLVPIAAIQLFSTIAAVSGLWRELEPQRPSIIMCSTRRKVTETSMLRHATLVCALGAALLFPLPVLAGHGHGHGGHGHGGHGHSHGHGGHKHSGHSHGGHAHKGGHGGHGHKGHSHAHVHHDDHNHHGHGHWWHGRWWGYGVGSCWRWTPYGYVWVCGY